jgi:hypothetical protein
MGHVGMSGHFQGLGNGSRATLFFARALQVEACMLADAVLVGRLCMQDWPRYGRWRTAGVLASVD